MKSKIIEDVGDVLRDAARTIVMPRFKVLRPSDIEMKAANDPVTIADREAEAVIGRALLQLIGDARVIGEEACVETPDLIKNLGKGTVWIIDPIDGTANYAAGRFPFAMMVALLKNGETINSWILDPSSDRLALAELGGGAWINGERLHTSKSSVAIDRLCGIISNSFVPPSDIDIVDRVRTIVRTTYPTARCAGHEYPLVASGERHFALYWRTLVWDHAPGALFLTEAGGSVTHLDGSPYCAARPKSGLLLTHNPLISKALLSSLSSCN